MFTITLRRQKCIGCNYCKQGAPEFFTISKKDGKSILLHSKRKRHTDVLRCANTPQAHLLDVAKSCPVRIIEINESKQSSTK